MKTIMKNFFAISFPCLFIVVIILSITNIKLDNKAKKYSVHCDSLESEIKHLNAEIKVLKLLRDTTESVDKKENKATDFNLSICNFHLGMTRTEYKNLIKSYKETGEMSIWDNNIYCMLWFKTSTRIPVREYKNSSKTFPLNQEFSLIFDKQPQFQNNKLTSFSFLIEPLIDNTNLVGVNNKNILVEYISNIIGSQPIGNRWEKQTTNVVLTEQKIKGKYYDNIDTYYRITISKK